jgi:hypothetical protein
LEVSVSKFGGVQFTKTSEFSLSILRTHNVNLSRGCSGMALDAGAVYPDILQQLYQSVSWLIFTHTTDKACGGS